MIAGVARPAESSGSACSANHPASRVSSGSAVAAAVQAGQQLRRPRPIARLLGDLADNRLAGAIGDVGPAARQRPATILGLAHEQQAVIKEYDPPDVDLGGGVAQLAREQ